jgi:hypothetical protein
MIVDQHQPVVEKYYGSGKMSSVIECLLEECDRVVKRLIDGWEQDRSMKRKVSLEAVSHLWILTDNPHRSSSRMYRVRSFQQHQALLRRFDDRFRK